MGKRTSALSVLRFAGAVVAFIIGSGFATGQEVMRFFTVYGVGGVWGQLLAAALLSTCCAVLMVFGFENRTRGDNPYRHFCGKIFGGFLEYFTPLFSFLLLIVMISGAGATMNQYLGISHFAGRAAMAAITAAVTIFGLNRLLDIIGCLGPFTILITLAIGVITVIRAPAGLIESARAIAEMENLPYSAGHVPAFWSLSAVLYAAFNLTCSIPFMTQMGATAHNKKEAALGGALGGVLLMLSALALNLAQICRLEELLPLEIPTLRLAQLISPVMGALFAAVLMGEIFSTAAPLLWTAANRLGGPDGSLGNKAAVAFVIILAFAGSVFPFGGLVGTIYPLSGYIGIGLIACVMLKTAKEKGARPRHLKISAKTQKGA